MKEYFYNGDVKKDLMNVNKKFDLKSFNKTMIIQFGIMLLFGVVLRLAGFIGNIFGYIGGFLGFSIGAGLINGKECAKEESKLALDRLENLYSDINLNFSNRVLSIIRIKECINIEKNEKVVENIESSIPVMSEEEKIVNYFYLLDPKDQIQVLRQIKNEALVYLLEEEDIKRENIEIPVEKVLRMKK